MPVIRRAPRRAESVGPIDWGAMQRKSDAATREQAQVEAEARAAIERFNAQQPDPWVADVSTRLATLEQQMRTLLAERGEQ